jgi:hypothetical protein
MGSWQQVVEDFKKYYPFWLGLIACIILSLFKDLYPLTIIIAFIVGYFRLTNFNR